MHDIERIAFLRMDRKFYFSLSGKHTPCLTKSKEAVTIHHGFRALLWYFEDPTRFGYVSCPLSLTSIHDIDYMSSEVLCARNTNRYLFKVELTINQPAAVLP